jgi:hypothetical protein
MKQYLCIALIGITILFFAGYEYVNSLSDEVSETVLEERILDQEDVIMDQKDDSVSQRNTEITYSEVKSSPDKTESNVSMKSWVMSSGLVLFNAPEDYSVIQRDAGGISEIYIDPIKLKAEQLFESDIVISVVIPWEEMEFNEWAPKTLSNEKIEHAGGVDLFEDMNVKTSKSYYGVLNEKDNIFVQIELSAYLSEYSKNVFDSIVFYPTNTQKAGVEMIE